MKLAASNFARRFIGVQGGESRILGNLAPLEDKKIGRIGFDESQASPTPWHPSACALGNHGAGNAGVRTGHA